MSAGTCQTCGGPLIYSTVGSGFDNPVLVHANTENWADQPHHPVPAPQESTDG